MQRINKWTQIKSVLLKFFVDDFNAIESTGEQVHKQNTRFQNYKKIQLYI
jgi:lipoprotein-releasing system permease protein